MHDFGQGFQNEFKRMSRRHDRAFKTVSVFIGVVWVLALAAVVAMGVLVFNVAGEVGDRGLKAVLTEIWEGPKAP